MDESSEKQSSLSKATLLTGKNVFLVPFDLENYERTLASELELEEYPDRPEPLKGYESVRFWGVRDGTRNLQVFERMEPGDLLLFYYDGQYIAMGFVGQTFEDEFGWASETFWDGAPAYHLYTVTEFVSLDLGRGVINDIFEYNADYYPQGLMRVADNRVSYRPAAIYRAVERFAQRNT